MNKDKTRFTADRRMFLKGFAVAGGSAAIAAVSATGLAEHTTEENVATAATEKTASKGYHETRHIRDYYRILRS